MLKLSYLKSNIVLIFTYHRSDSAPSSTCNSQVHTFANYLQTYSRLINLSTSDISLPNIRLKQVKRHTIFLFPPMNGNPHCTSSDLTLFENPLLGPFTTLICSAKIVERTGSISHRGCGSEPLIARIDLTAGFGAGHV